MVGSLSRIVRLRSGCQRWRLLSSVATATTSTSSIPTTTTSAQANIPRVLPQHRHLSTAPAEPSPQEPATLTPQDMHQEESKRQRLRDVKIVEVLRAKHSYRWVHPVIMQSASVQMAIESVIEGGLSAMMVLEEEHQHVVGLLTSRDLLRILASGFKDSVLPPSEVLQQPVGDFMTPISQVIYARPEETVGMCRTLMAKLGIKCLPILSSEGRVEGLITARDMSDYGLSATEKGGKENYLKDVSERVGLSSDTSMAEPPAYMKAHLALEQSPLFVNSGVACLPHPFKGDGRSIADDPELSEDAHFMTTVRLADNKKKTLRPFTYFGVADGVGSWREYGVDPRLFSQRLMMECNNILEEACQNARQDGMQFRQVVSPAEVMAQAHDRVKAENIIGSSTACVALFDGLRHQLHFSNLGDCGIIVLRHIDSNVAGTLKRNRTVPRTERVSDLQVAFVSQQQLKSFNHPYQLGWTGEELVDESTSFRSAREACTSSIHLRRGDIVIMATDGLFDNVELDDIRTMGLEWEQRCGFIRGGDIAARERRWEMGNSLTSVSADSVSELAETLCQRARENSLLRDVDSPFALLAKENDIMWSGGMPDDCTVLAIHVVGRDAHDTMDITNQ